jgi:20S proteasome subunit alpha 2
MGPDSRVLITKARKIAQKYMLTYGEPIPANQLVREVASVMQVSSLPLPMGICIRKD